MVDIPATLTLVGQAISITKDLREIDKGLNEAEFKLRIAELQNSLAEVKMALADALIELRAKDGEIERLHLSFRKLDTLVEVRGFKYDTTSSGQPQGTPYCPRCEVHNGRFYRLARAQGARGDMKCPECKSDYMRVTGYAWEDSITADHD